MLTQVIATFEDRVKEIEMYLALIEQENLTTSSIISIPNLSVMNASLIVMLYNLVEYTIQSSFIKIFDYIATNKLGYNKISPEICERWIHITYEGCYDRDANFNTYKKKAYELLVNAFDNRPIELTRKAMGIEWNINAKTIVELCGRFWIELSTWAITGEKLDIIKKRRNELAHWGLSFVDVWRDYTYKDLKEVTKDCVDYMRLILSQIDDYTKKELFLKEHYRATSK